MVYYNRVNNGLLLNNRSDKFMSKIYTTGSIYTFIVNGKYSTSIMPHYNSNKDELQQDISELYNIDVESIEEFKGTEKELTQYITL
jgi:ribosomal protein L23